MRRINKAKLFFVMAGWAVTLAVLSYFIKQQLGIRPESAMHFLVSGVIIGGGMLGGIALFNWLGRRGKLKWLEEK